MRSIDADAIANLVKIHKAISSGKGWSSDMSIDFIAGLIEDSPTVDAIPVEQVARMFFTLVGGTDPCSWNDMDYFAVRDDWCAEHCGETNCKEKTMQCWLHAIKEGWLDE